MPVRSSTFCGRITWHRYSSPFTSPHLIRNQIIFRFLILENYLEADPSELLEGPKIGFKLPEVLTVEEIDRIISAVDRSKAEGQRNRAILETLYSCGLRVSELITLKLSDLYFDEGFIKVEGKGSKQRLVPISPRAINEIKLYIPDRNQIEVKKGMRISFSSANGEAKAFPGLWSFTW